MSTAARPQTVTPTGINREPMLVLERDGRGRTRPTHIITFEAHLANDALMDAGEWLGAHPDEEARIVYVSIVRGDHTGDWMVSVAMRPTPVPVRETNATV